MALPDPVCRVASDGTQWRCSNGHWNPQLRWHCSQCGESKSGKPAS